MITTTLIASVALAKTTPDQLIIPGTGNYGRTITTKFERAQKFFNQGLNLMYAFNKYEAETSFRAAAEADPECAMAWWGIALSNGPDYNSVWVSPPDEKEAEEAIAKAITVMSDEPLVDQQIIQATKVRFNSTNTDRIKLETAFSKALAKVWATYPTDADLGTLYAESLMNLNPWKLWNKDGSPNKGTLKIVNILEDVQRINPHHPMAAHLYIHAIEASSTPEKGLRAADNLRFLQPGLGHNLHMPSHIYVRVGQWQKAIDANQRAIVADEAYRMLRPKQTESWGLMFHNWHMLAFAAMMTGQKQIAVQNIDAMLSNVPADLYDEMGPWLDGLLNMPIDVRIRFGMWDEVLDYPQIDSKYPMSKTLQHMARSMAHAAKQNPEKARMEQALFIASREKMDKSVIYEPIFNIAFHLMNGEICVAEGKMDQAIAHLKKGIIAEDSLDYSEPPQWIQPVRHTLGALLVKINRYDEALAVYNDDLKRLPNNGWSLYGKALSLENLGRTEEAKTVRNQFDEVWASSDTPITSSCICIPGSK